MRVAVPTTPASYFHLLRRQALSPKSKPLVVFTPKSLLRHRLRVSPVADFTTGTFQPVLADPAPIDPAAVKRVLLCSGKVFYDLLQARAERGITDTAIVRLEQLYPLPVDEIRAALASYPNAEDFAWVQEEPANQGAWSFVALNLLEHLDGVALRRVSRPAAAAPAVGSAKMHEAEQSALLEAALPRPPDPGCVQAGVPIGVRMPIGDPCLHLAQLAPGTREEDDDVLHRPGHRGAGRAPRRRDGQHRVASRAAARLRRRQPGVRDTGRTLRHLAGPSRR